MQPGYFDGTTPEWQPDTNLNQLAMVVRRLGEVLGKPITLVNCGDEPLLMIDVFDTAWRLCVLLCCENKIFTEAEVMEGVV